MAVWSTSTTGPSSQSGTISGRVTSATNQAPLTGVEVAIVGTTSGTVTDQQGRYTIPGVPAGPQRVRASMLGYAEATQSVMVAAGSTVTADLVLQQSVLQLGGVVATATGREQRQREIGSSVGVIDPSNVPMAAVNDMAQVIQGRVAGAIVMPSSGTTGSGDRIRIRGNNSLSLSNSPLIVVDGVRVNSH